MRPRRRLAVLPGLLFLASCSQAPVGDVLLPASPVRADRAVDFVLLDPEHDGEPPRGRLPGEVGVTIADKLDEVVVRAVSARPGQVVADVGCGGGRHALRIAEQVGPDGRVYCRELSAGLIEGLQKKLDELGVSNIDAKVSRPEDAGLPEASVDVILLADVYGMVILQQDETKAAFLQSLFRSLRPGGLVVVCYVRSVKSRRAEMAAVTDADFSAAGFEPGRRIRFDALQGEPLLLDYWRP